MKITKLLSIFVVSLFVLTSTGSALTIQPNQVGSWGQDWISGGTGNMVYDVTVASLNNTGILPVYTDNGVDSYQIGELVAGDLLSVRLALPSLSAGDTTVYVDFDSTGTSESWSFMYDGNFTKNPGWPAETGGPIFLAPQIPVPSDPANWNVLATEWDGSDSALHSIVDTTDNVFQISGDTNVPLNINSFKVNWDLDTGLMKNYTASWKDNDGSEFDLSLVFKYFRDESQWNLGWGVFTDDVFAFKFNTATINGTSGIEFGEENMGAYINSGDLMLIHIKELSNMINGPSWNGTVESRNFSRFDFDYKYVDIRRTAEPMFFIPIMPLGNANFLNNISDQFEAIGATVTVVDDVLNITIVGEQSAEWDLNTGLLLAMNFDGTTGQGHLVVDLELSYHWGFDGHRPKYSINSFEERYIIDDVTNGTNQYLDFGMVELHDQNGNPIEKEFKLYEGDVFQVSGSYESFEGENLWSWYGKTTSGFDVQAKFEQWYPGFEFGDGPPGLFFIIPNTLENETAGAKASDAYFVKVDRDTTTQNYEVHIDDLEFGFTTTQNGLTLIVRWDIATGLLNYYKVDGTDSETGNHVTWEMHRSEFNVRDPSTLSWNVAVGTEIEFQIIDTTGGVEFGDGGDTLATGDKVTASITHLGNFENEGPVVIANLVLNDAVTQADVQIGLQNPGFEFVSFDDENDGGPPLLYFVIPIGDADFYDVVAGMYSDAGYTTTNNATHLGVSLVDPSVAGETMDIEVEVYWEKATGLLVYYHILGVFDGVTLGFTIVQSQANIITPTSSNPTSEDGPAGLPVGNSAIFALPFMGLVTLVFRRKRA